MNCSSEILPFNNIIDQDKFTEALFELNSDFHRNISTISDKLLNPMVLNDKNFNPLFESDPDIQFYNEISTMYTDKSNYYFEDQLKQMLSESMTGNCLSIIHSNVRSLPVHQIEFESLLDYLCYNFSVIGLTETWLTTSNVSLYNFEGYRHIYNIRSGRAGGGVSLLIKSYIPFSERHDLNLLNEISETVFIKINKNVFGTPKDIIIGIIYRPPNTDPVAFN